MSFEIIQQQDCWLSTQCLDNSLSPMAKPYKESFSEGLFIDQGHNCLDMELNFSEETTSSPEVKTPEDPTKTSEDIRSSNSEGQPVSNGSKRSIKNPCNVLSSTNSTPPNQLVISEENCEECEFNSPGVIYKLKKRCAYDDVPAKIWEIVKDETILELAAKYKNNWKRISKLILETRNLSLLPRVLRKRYDDILSHRKSERVRFTHEDDLMIVKYLEKYGLDWTSVASHFEGKTPMMIKNRFYSFIKKRDLYDKYLQEVQRLEEQPAKEEEDFNLYQIELKKFLLDESNDFPMFNRTYFEMNNLEGEDGLCRHESLL